MLVRIIFIPLFFIFLLSGLPTHAAETKIAQPFKKAAPIKKQPIKIQRPVPVKKPVAKKPTASDQQSASRTSAAGTYRCWSYNVSGGGSGNCRLFAPLVLKKDGTYSLSSEKGIFTISGDSLTLSESKIRGIGKLIADTQIRFEYDYNKWHHVLTYLKQ